MQWEEGDEILIGNQQGDIKLLTLKSIDENGVATFGGELLSDMSSFEVMYGFDLSDITNMDVPYIEGNYRPFAFGTSTSSESFTINMFLPVFGMPLKGTAALTKIEASFNVEMDVKLTMNFETPLQLSSTPQIVYFPISSSFTELPLTFKFYDAGGLILTKKINKATCNMNQVITFTSDLEVNGAAPAPTYEYVDLGLSVNWATFNVGATKPEEYGDYFAWGETKPYYNTPLSNPITWKTGKDNGYDWKSYFDVVDPTASRLSFNKYSYGGTTKLAAEDDAATVNWGGNWRMPTMSEWEELQDNCNWSLTDNYNGTGVAGLIVTSKAEGNTNSIFLPAAGGFFAWEGCMEKVKTLQGFGTNGLYWTNEFGDEYSVWAMIASFNSMYFIPQATHRFGGLPVRPVCQKGE